MSQHKSRTHPSQTHKLSRAQQEFILHWGEMGTRWGINRTVAQIHALLYLSAEPLHAEIIVSTLAVARSNVSTSLRELQSWGLVKVVHVFGDRRDHFETEHDVWTLFRTVIEERKKREIDPTIATLKQCLAKAEASDEAAFVRDRIQSMLDFFAQIKNDVIFRSAVSNRRYTGPQTRTGVLYAPLHFLSIG